MAEERQPHDGFEGVRDSPAAASLSYEKQQLYEFGPFRLDPTERKLLRGNQIVPLTPKAFDVLLLLVRNSGHLLEKDELIRMVWPDSFVEEGSLANNIFLLRKALGEDPEFIETVPRQGYRFVGAVRQLPHVASAHPGTPAPVAATRRSRERLAWLVGSVFLISAGVLLLWVISLHRSPAKPQAIRFSIGPPERAVFEDVPQLPIVSPDGSKLAFIAGDSYGKLQLWIRPLDSESAQPLPGTENPIQPFWSADSRFLAFSAGNKLKKIAISGGPAQTLVDAPGLASGLDTLGTWSREGVVLFGSAGAGGVILRVSEAGGAVKQATTLDASREEFIHLWPHFLPDGKHFLYLALSSNPENNAIFVGSLDSKERKLLLKAVSNVAYVPQGYLLFGREGTLMAQPFDVERLELTGEAVPVAEGVLFNRLQGRTAFAASQNGVLAYRATTGLSTQLAWFDRAGKQISVFGDPAAYGRVELSPDGKRASVAIMDQTRRTGNIWLYDLARGVATRFTVDPASEGSSIWSPDGSRIVFSSHRKGHWDLYEKASNGAGAEEALLEDNNEKEALSWSPDGKFIMYWSTYPSNRRGKYRDLFVLPLSGDRKPFPFLNTQFNVNFSQFSPDGRWVAYTSDEPGPDKDEIYVAPFPGPGGKWRISTSGGDFPRWRHDGMEIFYLSYDGKLMAAAVNERGSSFEVGAVKTLFQTKGSPIGPNDYDVSADGQRFLMRTLPEQTESAPITVVLNWTAGLKK